MTTLDQVHDLLDDLSMGSGYWAGELSFMGCATLFSLEIPVSEIEDLTATLFDNDYGPTEMDLVADALKDRPVDPDTLDVGELVQVAERYNCDALDLAKALESLTGY